MLFLVLESVTSLFKFSAVVRRKVNLKLVNSFPYQNSSKKGPEGGFDLTVPRGWSRSIGQEPRRPELAQTAVNRV